jgi:hypothetical protein
MAWWLGIGLTVPCYLCGRNRVYQEVSATLQENVTFVNLRKYKQTYPYPEMNGYKGHDLIKRGLRMVPLTIAV